MEFGKHIGKGIWAFADKSLTAVYGIGLIFLVLRVLPEQEYGAFVIIQSVFMLVSTMAMALAFQPLTKFAAERADSGGYIIASLILSGMLFAVAALLLIGGKGLIIPLLDPQPQSRLYPLFGYLPLLFVTAWYRGFALGFLQAKFAVRDIFFVDASNILGSLGLVYVMTMLGRFHSADDLLQVMILAQAVSTILAMFFTFPLVKSSLRYERTALREVLNFGKYTFGTNSIYTFLMQADVFFVSSFSGLAAVAVYNAAKLFTRVFDMLSQVQQMFLIPYSSRRWGERDVSGLSVTAEKAICFSTLLLLPVLLLFVVFPAPLLEFLYHGKYPTAAPVLRVFGLLALVTPWNATAVSFIVGIGRVKEVFVISFLYAAITIPLYWLLTPLFGAVGTAAGLVGSFAVITVIYVRITQRIVPFTLTGVAGRVRDAWSFGRNLLQIGTQR